MEIYKITEHFPKEEVFGLTSQMSIASTSVNFNIVEGCGRGSDEDFKRMLRIASGSAFEVEYGLLLCKDLGLISEKSFLEMAPKAEELKMKISKLILKIQEDIDKKKNKAKTIINKSNKQKGLKPKADCRLLMAES
ncbi:four helix bundle protein [Chryseobacterium suipulveris]|uniref:Four helix bundle protein n=1 Tax=Chryseobacterium suipulveris TaxID=2929800 RepID=A0ABY4BRU1_9FLAO|nr:four helix bundle protein [Chryseobacterium suipulveris]